VGVLKNREERQIKKTKRKAGNGTRCSEKRLTRRVRTFYRSDKKPSAKEGKGSLPRHKKGRKSLRTDKKRKHGKKGRDRKNKKGLNLNQKITRVLDKREL